MQNRIGVLRRVKGFSLTDLAKAVGTTKAQIQKLERGDRRLSLDWMERLARALDVKMSDLLPTNEVACQHDPAEAAILSMIANLPEADRTILVQMAKRLVDNVEKARTKRSFSKSKKSGAG